LLEQSRAANQARAITGVLPYKEGNFMQLLEREESSVRNLYRKIALDSRHQGSMIFLRQTNHNECIPTGRWHLET
jgi:hypothetical protein